MATEPILKLSAAIILAAVTATLSAQPVKVNTKFDKVSPDEVKMRVYEPDTVASAVVLLDVSSTNMAFDAEGSLHLKTEHHERIKVFKEEGVSYGDYEIVYYTKLGMHEKVNGINVVTYNEENGQIVKTKMSKKYIFDEELTDNYRKVSFSAENVRAGSVIDVEYTVISYMYWDFDRICFQRDIPVNMLSYEVGIPEYVGVNRRMSGHVRIDYSSEVRIGKFLAGTQYIDFKINVDKYKAERIPAMRKEPYSYSYIQYLSGVSYDISYLDFPGRLTRHFSVKWEDVDKSMYESSITARLNDKCLFPDMVKAVMATDVPDTDKIMAIRNLVCSEVSWNGEYRLYPLRGSQVYKEKTGSNADRNALVGSCLRAAGYTVDPILLKRRTSGVLLTGLPELNPYSTFILRIGTSDGKAYYLDTSSSDLYLNILPPDMIVSTARLLREPGRCQWVDLTGICKNAIAYIVNAKLDVNGMLSGELTAKFLGEDCYAFKKSYRKAGSEDEFISRFENSSSVNVTGHSFQNIDIPARECRFSCSFEKDPDIAGDRIYVRPFISEFHSDSDFSPMTRTCPVEFPYKYMINYIFNLEIPEGYSLEQVPENMSVSLPCLKSAYKVTHQRNGRKVSIALNFILSEVIGLQDDYQQIREFWQSICKTYDEVLVISKDME
ncbi:MAG: DUF3857 domain-containing protein [Clostridium sp.]|nr:DUF3857 domain-containing protein [Bacteroides sp.]MCM1197621.1 DUF3857 domain-containing protein [Clostridium sp.]